MARLSPIFLLAISDMEPCGATARPAAGLC
jgi:hypothetical protein